MLSPEFFQLHSLSSIGCLFQFSMNKDTDIALRKSIFLHITEIPHKNLFLKTFNTYTHTYLGNCHMTEVGLPYLEELRLADDTGLPPLFLSLRHALVDT